MGQKLLDFGDLDHVFKVTPACQILTKKSLSALCLLNQTVILAKLYQLYHWDDYKNWLDFSDLDLIFKVTTL